MAEIRLFRNDSPYNSSKWDSFACRSHCISVSTIFNHNVTIGYATRFLPFSPTKPRRLCKCLVSSRSKRLAACDLCRCSRQLLKASESCWRWLREDAILGPWGKSWGNPPRKIYKNGYHQEKLRFRWTQGIYNHKLVEFTTKNLGIWMDLDVFYQGTCRCSRIRPKRLVGVDRSTRQKIM